MQIHEIKSRLEKMRAMPSLQIIKERIDALLLEIEEVSNDLWK